jgi:LysM repeat protein
VDTTPKAVAQKPQTHKVQKGETLYRIAKNYGVTVDQVKAWNNKSNNTIYPGETLQVAAGTVATAQPEALTAKGGQAAQSRPLPRYSATQPAANSQADKFHIVRAGETVASLALRYGYTEARFRQINGLNPNEMVKVGQQIKIDHCNCPDDAPSAYQQAQPRINAMAAPTQSGNNLQAKGSVPQSYNTAAPREPQTGSTTGETFSNDRFGSQRPEEDLRNTPYFLNRPSVQNPPPASYSREQPSAYDNPDYTPKGGNTPQSYDTYVPQRQQDQVRTVYIVKEGDSLFNIARTYGTTAQRLREINNLEKNEILIPYQRIYLN